MILGIALFGRGNYFLKVTKKFLLALIFPEKSEGLLEAKAQNCSESQGVYENMEKDLAQKVVDGEEFR